MKKVTGANLIAMLALVAILTGCSSNAGDAKRGQDIFLTGGSAVVNCQGCHTLNGSRLIGPSFKGISAVAGSRIEGLSAEEYLRQSITHPSSYIVDGYPNVMPVVFRYALEDQEVNDLIAFLMTQ